MSTLVQLPADLLLLVLADCSLADIFAFSAVCHSFRSLSLVRSLWITVLTRTRCIHPIPTPTHQDLTTLSLNHLRSLALHTLRLHRNLSLPEPKIIGPIKSVQLDANLDLVFQIPGTELYLFHCRASGSVVCWDVGLGKAVTKPLHVGNRVLDVSPGEDLPGMFSMSCLLQRIDDAGIWDSLVVLRVSHADRTNVQIDLTFQQGFANSNFHWAVFMNSEIVGVLRIPRNLLPDTRIAIVAFNRFTHKRVTIDTDIPYDERPLVGHSGSSSYSNDVFILIECEDLSFRYRCPASLLPYRSNPNCPVDSRLNLGDVPRIGWGTPLPGRMRYTQIGPLSADPAYGVPLKPQMHIRFWTRSDKEEGFAHSTPTIVPVCFINIPGDLWSSASHTWQLMLLPHSGRQVLLVVKDDEEIKLLLVRLQTEKKTATVHRLNVPSFIGMDHVYGLSLDDHRGVVTLLDTRGFLFAIPYA
ncbi:hypothetical protein BDQ17DRAFT_1387237 [Cyathus striatus]|nr:hypothetical protein BDQ17DRAFT_1387237 [Cyathus striatus]